MAKKKTENQTEKVEIAAKKLDTTVVKAALTKKLDDKTLSIEERIDTENKLMAAIRMGEMTAEDEELLRILEETQETRREVEEQIKNNGDLIAQNEEVLEKLEELNQLKKETLRLNSITEGKLKSDAKIYKKARKESILNRVWSGVGTLVAGIAGTAAVTQGFLAGDPLKGGLMLAGAALLGIASVGITTVDHKITYRTEIIRRGQEAEEKVDEVVSQNQAIRETIANNETRIQEKKDHIQELRQEIQTLEGHVGYPQTQTETQDEQK